MKQKAFEVKQRAIRQALVIGEEIRSARSRQLVAAAFTAWRVQVG
jgi:hypothetical protein